MKQEINFNTTSLVVAGLFLYSFASSTMSAHNNSNIANGRLVVQGELIESACHLDMTSKWQEIDLGTIYTKDFARIGVSGTPIPFSLRLVNCIRGNGRMTDKTKTTITEDHIQPVISVSFQSTRDDISHDLIKVDGISGLALKITSNETNHIKLGYEDRPKFIEASQGQLNYQIVPVRTGKKLTPGNFRSVIDFRIHYD